MRLNTLKLSGVSAAALALFGAGWLVGANAYNRPKSIIHMVEVQWKEGTTPAQKKAAIDGVLTVAAAVPGIKNVWLKSQRVQPNREFGGGDWSMDDAFAIEFESQAAHDAYEKSPERQKWFDGSYNPHRSRSISIQVTN